MMKFKLEQMGIYNYEIVEAVDGYKDENSQNNNCFQDNNESNMSDKEANNYKRNKDDEIENEDKTNSVNLVFEKIESKQKRGRGWSILKKAI